MASTANSTDKERARSRGAVSTDLQGHHRSETADRNRRQQRRSFEIRKAREIGYEIEIGTRFSIQLASSSVEGHRVTHHCETVTSGSCK